MDKIKVKKVKLPERIELSKEVVDQLDPIQRVEAAKDTVRVLRENYAITPNEEYLLLEALKGPILPSFWGGEFKSQSFPPPDIKPVWGKFPPLPSDDRYRCWQTTTTSSIPNA